MDLSGQLHSPAALPRGNRPCTHWIGSWAGPRAGLYVVCNKKNLSLPGIERRPFSPHEENKKCVHSFWWKSLSKETTWRSKSRRNESLKKELRYREKTRSGLRRNSVNINDHSYSIENNFLATRKWFGGSTTTGRNGVRRDMQNCLEWWSEEHICSRDTPKVKAPRLVRPLADTDFYVDPSLLTPVKTNPRACHASLMGGGWQTRKKMRDTPWEAELGEREGGPTLCNSGIKRSC
jgi:hypothetical protein